MRATNSITCVSAIGSILLIVPENIGPNKDECWHLHGFGLSGRWQFSRRCGSKAEATKERSRMFRWHRKLAKQRAEKRKATQ